MTTDLERRVRAGLREYVESVPVGPPPAPSRGGRPTAGRPAGCAASACRCWRPPP